MALWKPSHPHKTPSSKVMNIMKIASIAAHMPAKVVELVEEKKNKG